MFMPSSSSRSHSTSRTTTTRNSPLMAARPFLCRQADAAVEAARTAHVDDIAYRTLLPLADSFYRGANVPGKPDRFMPYAGGGGGRQLPEAM